VAASTLVYQLLPAGTSRAQRICSHMEHTQDLLLPGWRSEHAGRDSSCRHSDRDAYDRRSVTAALLNLGGAEIVGSPEEPTTVRYGRVRRVLDRLTDLPRRVDHNRRHVGPQHTPDGHAHSGSMAMFTEPAPRYRHNKVTAEDHEVRGAA